MKKLLLTLVLALSISTVASANNEFKLTKSKASFSSLTAKAGAVQTRGRDSGFTRCVNDCNANAVSDCINGGQIPAICEGAALEVCLQRCSMNWGGGYF